MADRIVRDPKIVSGRPIVAGSLVTVEAVLQRLMAGYSIMEVAKELLISIQDVRAAIEYAIESLPGSLPPPPKPAPRTLSPKGLSRSEEPSPGQRFAFTAIAILRDAVNKKRLARWEQGGDRVVPKRDWIKTLKAVGWPMRVEELLMPQTEHRGPRIGQQTKPAFQPVTVVPGCLLRAFALEMGIAWEVACRWEVPDGA